VATAVIGVDTLNVFEITTVAFGNLVTLRGLRVRLGWSGELALVLRMLAYFVKETTFRQGVGFWRLLKTIPRGRGFGVWPKPDYLDSFEG